MALNLPHGSYTLRVLLFIRPEAASKARRDATPLRLISWLSYKLNPELEQFIEQAMEHLSTWKETEGGNVLTMGKDAIPQGETINSEVELRDRLIDLVSVGDLKHKPEIDPLLGPCPPPTYASTSGLGGRRKDSVELSPYQAVAREAV